MMTATAETPRSSPASSPRIGVPAPTLAQVQAVMAAHIPLYRRHKPVYQTELMGSFAALWDPSHRRVLDVGGGTGIIAQLMVDLFGGIDITSVDVENRFLPTLTFERRVYDGVTMPFADGAFDCATMSNVMHHVPKDVRAPLMAEIARVTGGGPILIKDHLAASAIDHRRLYALDVMGNVPFGGMVKANYLTAAEWQALASGAGYTIERQISGTYRTGAFATAFPNRLEITMRLVRAG